MSTEETPMPRRIPRLPLWLACCFFAAAQAQAFDVPEVAWPGVVERAAAPSGFVPPGWRIEHEERGLLDDDALEDVLLVLRMDDPGNIIDNDGPGPDRFDTNPRMLVAAVATSDGDWRQVMVDQALVPRPVNPAMEDALCTDSSCGVEIRPDRTWRVSLGSWSSAGSWSMRTVAYTFRFERDCMRLLGYDDMDLHRASGAIMERSVNYLSGRAWTQRDHIGGEGPEPKQWTRLASKEPVCIGDVGHGFSFTPDLPEPAPPAP